MRYRIFDKSTTTLVTVLVDRPAFDKAFHGKNPNNPIGGLLVISGKKYIITDYLESKSNEFTENEFHEIEQEWFARVVVADYS